MTKFWIPLTAAAWIGFGSLRMPAGTPQWGFALEGNPVTTEQLAAVKENTGLGARWIVCFQQWPEDPSVKDFPRGSLNAITDLRAMPVITWEPMYYQKSDGAETMIAAEAIIQGKYDGYITNFARAAAAWGQPMVIRFAHEMNLSRYHWGSPKAAYGPASPERYRAMWRHVVTVFRQAKAINVRWAFCPNCESVPGAGNPAAAPWNTARAYYPGDDVVDLLGMDGYNWGDTQTPEKNGWRSSWRSFASTFGALQAELHTLAPAKPIVVFETASAATGGDKAQWLAELATTARAWDLAGVVWFEAKKEIDWRLRTGVAAEAIKPLKAGFGGAR